MDTQKDMHHKVPHSAGIYQSRLTSHFHSSGPVLARVVVSTTNANPGVGPLRRALYGVRQVMPSTAVYRLLTSKQLTPPHQSHVSTT